MFVNAIKKAEKSCEEGGEAISDHFAHVSDMIEVGKGAKRPAEDVRLSRYACYLIIENADPEKPIVALGQRYFAVQTRRQELTDAGQDEITMPEDQLRLIRRSQLAINFALTKISRQTTSSSHSVHKAVDLWQVRRRRYLTR